MATPRLKIRPAHRLVVTDADARAVGASSKVIPADYPPLVLVAPMDLWIVKPLSADWLVGYRVVVQDGHVVVGEMRIYPNEHQGHGGAWSGELLGVKARVPAGGLSATTIRAATLGQDVARMLPEILTRIRSQFPTLWGALQARGVQHDSMPTQPRQRLGGRAGRAIAFYARVAALYADALAGASNHPVRAVVRATGLSASQARNAVAKARRLGFLSPTTRGASAGVLTAAGRAALRLPRIATNSETGGSKGSQPPVQRTKKARKSP